MIAMILAAGLGERMRPLTMLRAKPALPVLNRPLLQWTVERLAAQGITDLLVNVHHLPDTVTAALGDGRHLGVRIRYSREDRILGTGGGPRAVRDLLGSEPFLIVNGDVLFDFDLQALARRHRESGARATLALRRNPDPARYGPVVTDRRGRVLSIAGLPRRARGTVSLFTGIHVVDPALLDRLPPGPSSIVPALYAPLVAEGAVILGRRVEGPWYDLGRPRLYLETQLRWLRRRGGGGRSLVDAAATVAAGARIHSAVVGAGAEVQGGARVERSVLWHGARVEAGASVADSIVVDGAVVRKGEVPRGRVVLPSRTMSGVGDEKVRVERRGEMTWVPIQ